MLSRLYFQDGLQKREGGCPSSYLVESAWSVCEGFVYCNLLKISLLRESFRRRCQVWLTTRAEMSAPHRLNI